MTTHAATNATMTPEQENALREAQAAAPASANDNAPEALVADEAAREPLPAVEKAIAPTPEAIMPRPHVELPKPPQAVGEVAPMDDAKVENLTVLPAMLASAEKHLASHIGAEIDPILAQNLVLNVSSNLQKGTTSLVLALEGDMVAANPAVLGEQVIAALHTLPAMQTLFAEHHHTPTAEFHDGKLQVVIPHLATAQYAHLIQALATSVEVAREAPKDSVKEELPLAAMNEQAALPAGHQCDASCTHAPSAEVAAAVAEAPATIVEGPAHPQKIMSSTLAQGIAG